MIQKVQVERAIANYLEAKKSKVLGSVHTLRLDSILRYYRFQLVPETTEHYTITATNKEARVILGDETFTFKL